MKKLEAKKSDSAWKSLYRPGAIAPPLITLAFVPDTDGCYDPGAHVLGAFPGYRSKLAAATDAQKTVILETYPVCFG
ncbi:MAG: hypothetical protein JW822_12195 [Spirochaetales bacterium]|nr:hypothetical protein [Spirochaetales bacterium]